jgi:hypothetical protein
MLEAASTHKQKQLHKVQGSEFGDFQSEVKQRQIAAGFEWHIHPLTSSISELLDRHKKTGRDIIL